MMHRGRLVGGRKEMTPQLAALIIEVAGEYGVRRADLLAGTGIRPAQLDREDSFIPYAAMMTLIANALSLCERQDLGLLVGMRQNIGTWGILGYALMSCSTFREAFFTGLQFHKAAGGMLELSAQETGGRLCLTMEEPLPLGDILPFCVEEMVAGILNVLGGLVGESLRALELEVTYPSPVYAEEYKRILPCQVHYKRAANRLYIATPDDTPLPNADPLTARLCRRMVSELLDKHCVEDNLVREVRRLIMRTPGRIPGMEEVAGELGISSRSLRRQLDALGASYKQLVDDVRLQLAKNYLSDSSLTLERIAQLLGYTEVTNFRRAFRQWTGQPPGEFRQTAGKATM